MDERVMIRKWSHGICVVQVMTRPRMWSWVCVLLKWRTEDIQDADIAIEIPLDDGRT